MFKLNRLSLVHQIALAATTVSLLIFAGLIAFTTYFAEHAALAKTEEELNNQIQSIVRMLELNHGNAVSQANKSLARMKDNTGKLRFGPDTMASGSYQVPVVRSGDRIINGNTALLESIKRQIDADPALLIRVGDEFVRGATLLKTKDGKSTEGTPIPANAPETRALLSGKSYTGVVRRSGKYYISAIEPVLGEDGKVIGALAARVDIQGDMERLFGALGEIKSGATGYAYVLAPQEDATKTELIHHPSFAGKTLAEIGNPRLSEIVAEQVRRKQGLMTYPWSRPGSTETAQKMIVFDSAPSWGWIVATGSFIDEFTVEARQLRNTLIALCIGGALLLALVLYLITRNRLSPIKGLLDATRRIGDGDLSVHFPETAADSANELDQITRSLDSTTRKIGALIGDVIHTANTVKDSARTVRLGSDEVVNGTTSQSEAAAGLASAIEELSVSITHVSDSAAMARDITQQAQAHADDGGLKVRNMISGMDRIADEINKAGEAVNLLSERSARISNIGKIINEIADQTNLLALNAAIEAARAGESGRGFAVVADEVRKLAERTASSTREISATVSEVQGEADRVVAMIKGVTGDVRQGVELATDSGVMLDTIRSESGRTTGAVNDIADATREQSAASQEVARGVERIAQMAEQNNQITRHTHEQTAVLEQLAADLEAKVSHFRV
ncbi:methyl-accepting chemotaxis protein [Zoogloea sp.]|uniref:methyl-accepting chemotaxis protein n=1 Tax=Zoogloea sp. TaxID=49181 RepID=UPI0025E8C45C|nr:methyl-accepting chemotaxis protein [Zoogloea sp.]MCK6374516.1 methyl-accepting chemotaxis protein [Zoogloea sp.]MCK6392272.1 methyl-accepting chemotaxis protein [Zoogloea sp.]